MTRPTGDPSIPAGLGARDPRFRRGVEHFDRGEYFEAHEVWENQWYGLSGEDRVFVQMLIQAAVALHHAARGNLVGSRALRKKTLAKLSALPARRWGLDLAAFAAAFAARLPRSLDGGDATDAPPPRLGVPLAC